MRALIQRVSSASVRVGDDLSQIGPGLMILLGVRRGDIPADAAWLAVKCAGLRIFEDANEKMNLSLLETGGEALVVSQFTLYGDADRGRRPSFTEAAPPEDAEPLYRHFVAALQAAGVKRVATGVFQAMMTVTIVNEGPVTIVVDSRSRGGEGATAKPDPISAFTQVFYSLEKPLVLASASPRRADLLKSLRAVRLVRSRRDLSARFPSARRSAGPGKKESAGRGNHLARPPCPRRRHRGGRRR
jgi:D-tyrosyl-tRNA(Tyr) deacylase